ncbi:hypothetical protein NAC44_18005 [Allorhizobium sp. BGMRC 0089]|uniref:hypothetical protein n=1 Tax=Allorhizobium sonneratiae TaxID=2934936 RepID=UPI0020338F6C|nr:hypothetical protein [Allorhizobium sonneratiae]MCM2294224.1 hypothetical protein [Allorhizobium sonneratiae]
MIITFALNGAAIGGKCYDQTTRLGSNFAVVYKNGFFLKASPQKCVKSSALRCPDLGFMAKTPTTGDDLIAPLKPGTVVCVM